MVKRRWLGCVAFLALASCTGNSNEDAGPVRADSRQIAAAEEQIAAAEEITNQSAISPFESDLGTTPPSCAEVFAVGAVIVAEEVRAVCIGEGQATQPSGQVFECEDDRVLIGNEQIFGFSGGTMRESGDPDAFGRAYEECLRERSR